MRSKSKSAAGARRPCTHTPGIMSGRRQATITRALRQAIAHRSEVVFAYLFGSFSEDLPFRDIDVAVWINEGKGEKRLGRDPWRYEAQLEMELAPLVGVTVDVTMLNHASLPLRYHATRGELLFSRNEIQRCTFLEETWRDYFEMEPYLNQFLRDILRE